MWGVTRPRRGDVKMREKSERAKKLPADEREIISERKYTSKLGIISQTGKKRKSEVGNIK